MAKKRASKRKSETKTEKEPKPEQIENGDTSSKSPKKTKKSSVKDEVKKISVSKTLNKTKTESDEEDNTDYEVEKIIDVRNKANKKREFRIRWKNYSAKHDTWEPEENLSCDELIAKFLENAEKVAKTPRKELRENRKSTTKFESSVGRKSRRTAGNRKNYTEDADVDY